MNALSWSIVLDTAVAIKIHFTKTALKPFEIIERWGQGNDHSRP